MDVAYNSKQLITIEYPGTVVNIDKMTETLGGEKEMIEVFRNSTKRLELKFRPEDPYCKSIHGDRFNATNLLLKVVKRTKKRKSESKSASAQMCEKSLEENVDYKVEMLGIACTSYKFKALADFQTLPITFDKSEQKFKSMIPDLNPTTLLSTSTWLDKDVELFIPPLLFSRFDLPQNGYSDIQNKTPKAIENNPRLPLNIIGQSRKRRAGFAVFATFDTTEPLDEPQPEAILQLKSYSLEIEVKKRLDILFEERPIWTRNALVGHLKCERSKLKHSLPCTAYYFTNGPWRALWVRFGYDPRKDPSSKIYQIMDLRINPNIPINESKNKRRQTYYTLPNKSTQNVQRAATINTEWFASTSKDESVEDEDYEDEDKRNLLAYEYFPGELPTYRQCFYQLCDIHLESVQKLVHQNDGQEDYCHEKEGWCLPGTLEKCRELIVADILKTNESKGIMNSN